MDELQKIQPREYQQKIFEACSRENCLVVLPTGMGKTLIALMLAIDRFKKFPLEKVLILAPTRPLVEQHLRSFQKNLPDSWANMQLFTGKVPAAQRKRIWQTAEFIFSTPQCIDNDVRHGLYSLKDVCLLVEDECHRCLKNYAYTNLAKVYLAESLHPRILGITASPGSDKETITKVCSNLGITAVEIRTRGSEDVKPYIQELEFEKIHVDFPAEFEEIRQLLKAIYDKKVQELKNRKVLFQPATKVSLLQTQQRLFISIKNGNKNPNSLAAVSVCSQAIKLGHALELLETQTLQSFTTYMQSVFQQAKEKKSRGVQRLAADPAFIKAYTLATTTSLEHPKLIKLIDLLSQKIVSSPKSKTLIFAQYRDTVAKIASALNKIPGMKAKTFVGQAKKGTKEGGNATGLNQREQKQIIAEFSEGTINCLVSTSIGEEGLDIPEVDEVIFYEPVPSAIRKIQRSGRTARLSAGSLKILITKNTRDQIHQYASAAKERRMHAAIDEIKNKMDFRVEKKEKQDTLF